MIIIVSGTPGSGKSTLVNKIAEEFGLEKVFASIILKEIMDGELRQESGVSVEEGFWETNKGKEFAKKRLQNHDFDKKLDNRLKEIINTSDNLVVDSRTMPWLSDKGFKIFIKADEEIRVQRIATRDNISIEQAKQAVERLETDKKLYKELYNIDFDEDFSVFDLVVDSGKMNAKEVAEYTILKIKKALE